MTLEHIAAELHALFPPDAVPPDLVASLQQLATSGPPVERVRLLSEHIRDATRLIDWYSKHRDLAVGEMRAAGASYDQVATVLGLSRSRAQQLCQRLAGAAPPRACDLDPRSVRADLHANLPEHGATAALEESILATATTGTAEERAAALTRRTAVTTRVVDWYSGHRDRSLRELVAQGAGAAEVAAALGVSRTWGRTLVRRATACS